MTIAIFLLSSFLLALACTGWLINYLSEDLLDIPNQRSSHTKPVLRGGGLGFIIAFALSGLVLTLIGDLYPDLISDWKLSSHVASFLQICLVLTPLTIVGFIDDRKDISASIRYFVQVLSAAIAIACFGTIPLPWLSGWGLAGEILGVVISLVAITASINFYNFMDGLDGFVASITALQLAFIAVHLREPIFLLFTAALIGFLWWNWSPAKIFMGDVGSTVLGAAVAIALMRGSQDVILSWSVFTVIFPLIGDSIYTLVRRLINRKNIFQPHRTHIYQRLQQSGLSHNTVALIYLILTTIFANIVDRFGVASIGLNLGLTIIAICCAKFYFYLQSSKLEAKS
jgi:Fuc2NAc and GlcNAc transferase